MARQRRGPELPIQALGWRVAPALRNYSRRRQIQNGIGRQYGHPSLMCVLR